MATSRLRHVTKGLLIQNLLLCVLGASNVNLIGTIRRTTSDSHPEGGELIKTLQTWRCELWPLDVANLVMANLGDAGEASASVLAVVVNAGTQGGESGRGDFSRNSLAGKRRFATLMFVGFEPTNAENKWYMWGFCPYSQFGRDSANDEPYAGYAGRPHVGWRCK